MTDSDRHHAAHASSLLHRTDDLLSSTDLTLAGDDNAPPPQGTSDSWVDTAGGNWGLAANWSAGVPTASSNVTIAAAGSYAVSLSGTAAVNALTLDYAAATLSMISGGTLSIATSLALEAGTIALNTGADIAGGTLIATGGVIEAYGGTLSNLTFAGTLNLSASEADLTAAGTLTMTSGSVINVTGEYASFYLDTSGLNNATIDLGNSQQASNFGFETLSGPAATFTLGSGVVIDASGFANFYENSGINLTSNTLVNDGTISEAGGTLILTSLEYMGTLVNNGSLIVSAGGTLDIDNQSLASLGSFSTTGSGSELLLTSSTLTNTGATLSLGTASALALGVGSGIVGGTIDDGGNGLIGQGGTLSGVAYNGTLNLTQAGATLEIINDCTLSSNGGAGVVNITGAGADFVLGDTETLNNLAITLGNATQTADFDMYPGLGEGGVFGLGSGVTIAASGSSELDFGELGSSGTLVSAAAISNTGIGSTLTLSDQFSSGGTFVNSALISDSGSLSAFIISNFANSAAFVNTGTLAASGDGTIELQGLTIGVGDLGHFTTLAGGELLLVDTDLTNSGLTLSLTGTDQITLGAGGDIIGGTVSNSGTGLVAQGGTLTSATYAGTLTLTTAGAALTFTDGVSVVTGGGKGVIDVTGSQATLTLDDSQTLTDATLDLGNSSKAASFDFVTDTDAAGTFTLGSSLDVVASGKAAINFDMQGEGGVLINDGTISATGAATLLTIDDQSAMGTLINDGTLSAATKGTIELQYMTLTVAGLGDFTTGTNGTLLLDNTLIDNSGTTLAVGTGKVLTLGTGADISGGTISDSGGGIVSPAGTLTGVTYDGTLTLATKNANLTLLDGLTVSSGSNAGIVSITGAGATLSVVNAQTINATMIDIGNATTAASVLFTTNTDLATNFTLGSTLTVAASALASLVFDNQGVGGKLINDGTLSTSATGAVLSIIDSSGKGTFSNANIGTLSAAGGTLSLAGVTDFSNMAAGTLTGGTYIANAASVLLLTNNTSLTTLSANVVLNGTGSVIESRNSTSGSYTTIDQSLVSITQTGNFTLEGGRNFTSSGTLTDAGSITLNGDLLSAAALVLTSTGNVTGYGTLAGTVADAGKINASGGTLALTGALSGAGTLIAKTGGAFALNGTGTLTNIEGAGGAATIGGTYGLGGGLINISTLTVAAGGLLSGAGTLSTPLIDNGVLAAAGGTLTLNNQVSGTGTLAADSGATLAIAGAGTFAGTLAGTGVIALETGLTLNSGAVLAGGDMVDTAQITLGTGATLTESAGATLIMQASSAGTLRITGGTAFDNAGTVLADGAATGVAQIADTLTNTGTMTLNTGSMTFLDAVTNGGVIADNAGSLSIKNTIGGTGSMTIGSTGTLALTMGAGSGQAVDFLAGTGALDLTKPIEFLGSIAGFGASDVIDLLNTAETSYSFTNSVLTIDNNKNIVAQLQFTGSYSTASFTLASDGNGGTLIKFS